MGDAVLRLWQRGEGAAPVVEPVMRSRFAAGAELLDAGGEPAGPPEPGRMELPADGSATYDASGAFFPSLLAGDWQDAGAASLLSLLRSPPLVEAGAPFDPDVAREGGESSPSHADPATPPASARGRADTPAEARPAAAAAPPAAAPLLPHAPPLHPGAPGHRHESQPGPGNSAAPRASAPGRVDPDPADARDADGAFSLPRSPAPPAGDPASHPGAMEDRHTRTVVMPEAERHDRAPADAVQGRDRIDANARAAAASPAAARAGARLSAAPADPASAPPHGAGSRIGEPREHEADRRDPGPLAKGARPDAIHPAAGARQMNDVQPAAADLPGSPPSGAPEAAAARPSATARADFAFDPSVARAPAGEARTPPVEPAARVAAADAPAARATGFDPRAGSPAERVDGGELPADARATRDADRAAAVTKPNPAMRRVEAGFGPGREAAAPALIPSAPAAVPQPFAHVADEVHPRPDAIDVPGLPASPAHAPSLGMASPDGRPRMAGIPAPPIATPATAAPANAAATPAGAGVIQRYAAAPATAAPAAASGAESLPAFFARIAAPLHAEGLRAAASVDVRGTDSAARAMPESRGRVEGPTPGAGSRFDDAIAAPGLVLPAPELVRASEDRVDAGSMHPDAVLRFDAARSSTTAAERGIGARIGESSADSAERAGATDGRHPMAKSHAPVTDGAGSEAQTPRLPSTPGRRTATSAETVGAGSEPRTASRTLHDAAEPVGPSFGLPRRSAEPAGQAAAVSTASPAVHAVLPRAPEALDTADPPRPGVVAAAFDQAPPPEAPPVAHDPHPARSTSAARPAAGHPAAEYPELSAHDRPAGSASSAIRPLSGGAEPAEAARQAHDSALTPPRAAQPQPSTPREVIPAAAPASTAAPAATASHATPPSTVPRMPSDAVAPVARTNEPPRSARHSAVNPASKPDAETPAATAIERTGGRVRTADCPALPPDASVRASVAPGGARPAAPAAPPAPGLAARTVTVALAAHAEAPPPEVADVASASAATVAPAVSAARAATAAPPPASAASVTVAHPASAASASAHPLSASPPSPAAPAAAAAPSAALPAGITPAERPAERASTASRRAAAERMPSVQVEIGRVEVTSPAPPARPRRARAGPLTPLDEYARRWGGGRR